MNIHLVLVIQRPVYPTQRINEVQDRAAGFEAFMIRLGEGGGRWVMENRDFIDALIHGVY